MRSDRFLSLFKVNPLSLQDLRVITNPAAKAFLVIACSCLRAVSRTQCKPPFLFIWFSQMLWASLIELASCLWPFHKLRPDLAGLDSFTIVQTTGILSDLEHNSWRSIYTPRKLSPFSKGWWKELLPLFWQWVYRAGKQKTHMLISHLIWMPRFYPRLIFAEDAVIFYLQQFESE